MEGREGPGDEVRSRPEVWMLGADQKDRGL